MQKLDLLTLFKKTSSNYKEMTFDEFQVLLEKLAIIMFEDKDDELPSDLDKVEAFYKFIGLENQNFYRQQMQLLQPPFNIKDDVGFRLLPKDVGRPIKLHKIPPKLIEELKRRKEEKMLLYNQ